MMTENVNTTRRSETIMITTAMMMRGGGGSVVGNNNTNLVTIAMSTLIDLSRKKEIENKSGEETVDKIDDDNNCEAVAKQTSNNIEHDRNCVVEANTEEKEGVYINNEEGKEEDNKFDIDSLYNH